MGARYATNPVLLDCERDTSYVVKLQTNPEGPHVLAAELICYQLALRMGLPVPAFALVEVPDQLVAINPGAGLSVGLHFGSEFVRNAFPAPSLNILGRAKNLWVVPDIVGFDYWVYNSDRAYNSGNLLFAQNRDAFELLMIDFSHAFWGAIWTAVELAYRKTEFDSSWFAQPVYARLVPHINGNSPFYRFLKRFAELADDDLVDIIATVPECWGLASDERRDLADFLISRKQALPRVLSDELSAYLPLWKRGD